MARYKHSQEALDYLDEQQRREEDDEHTANERNKTPSKKDLH